MDTDSTVPQRTPYRGRFDGTRLSLLVIASGTVIALSIVEAPTAAYVAFGGFGCGAAGLATLRRS